MSDLSTETLPTRDMVCAAAIAMAAKGLDAAETQMLSLEQAPCEVFHRFGPGIYIRELHMQAGTFAIGHAQRFSHTNIILNGGVLMVHPDGSTNEVRGPLMFLGKPGRKMGLVLEDTVWLNIFATDETDIDKLEAMFFETSQQWSEFFQARIAIEREERSIDRDDFASLLREFGFNAEQARQQSENLADQISMPEGWWKFRLGQSPIEGAGMFLTAAVEAEEFIGPARLNGMRTPLGRYINHSKTPNSAMRKLPNGDVGLFALRAMHGAVGGQHGEEITIDYRQALRDVSKLEARQ